MSRAKAEAFGALHERGTFVLPTAWDLGSARVLAELGYAAIELSRETSAMLGSEEKVLSLTSEVVSTTDLPVTVDIGAQTDGATDWIEEIGKRGAVGVTLQSSDPGTMERVTKKAHASNLLLTARSPTLAETDLGTAIGLLLGYERAGADILELPGLRSKSDFARVLDSVTRPLSVPLGHGGVPPSIEHLAKLGVRRIATGTTLLRRARAAFIAAAREIRTNGTFEYLVDADDELLRIER